MHQPTKDDSSESDKYLKTTSKMLKILASPTNGHTNCPLYICAFEVGDPFIIIDA